MSTENVFIIFIFITVISLFYQCVVRAGRAAPQFICMNACGDAAGRRLRATARFYFIPYFSGNKNRFTSFIFAFVKIILYSRVYRRAVCWRPTHSRDKSTASLIVILLSRPFFYPYRWNYNNYPSTEPNT